MTIFSIQWKLRNFQTSPWTRQGDKLEVVFEFSPMVSACLVEEEFIVLLFTIVFVTSRRQKQCRERERDNRVKTKTERYDFSNTPPYHWKFSFNLFFFLENFVKMFSWISFCLGTFSNRHPNNNEISSHITSIFQSLFSKETTSSFKNLF